MITTAMPSIQLQNVELRRSDEFRLGPISIDLAPGSRTALIGPSGCGKTTLLRVIAGLETPDGGQVRLGGTLATDGRRSLVAPGERGIGFVFQDAALWPHLTAVEHLRFVAPGLSVAAVDERLAAVGLTGLGARRPGEMSGGEAQRLALARALVGGARILLLDEPLSSVDVHLRDDLVLLVRRLAERETLTLVVVTHDRDEALSMADDVVILGDGRIVEAGTAATIVADPRTAFSARFLAHAACFPIGDDGTTTFGAVTMPDGLAPADAVLAVLPGDVGPVAGAGAEARVVQVRNDGLGHTVALLEVDGLAVTLPSANGLVAGEEIRLGLSGSPRVLPRGAAT